MAARTPRRAGGGPEAVGALLTRLRLARGYTQLRLAELLCAAAGTTTVTRNEVSRWEREDRIPGEFWLGWLAVVLEAPLDQLEAAVAATRRRAPEPAPAPVDHHRLWRPPSAGELLAALDHATVHDFRELAHAWLAGPPEPAGLAPPAPPAPPAPSGPAGPALPAPALVASGGTLGDTLDGLAARLGELRRQDDQVGGLDHAGLVGDELRVVLDLLRAAGIGSMRRRTLQVVAGYAQLAGWAHADAGDGPAARRAYRVGLRAAAAAGDRPLAAHVLGALSHQSLVAGDAAEALLLARTGAGGARGEGSARTQALLLQRVAHASARLGERRAAEVALANSERVFDRSQPDREPDWLYWLDAAELSAMTGRCLVVLGRPLRAAQLLATRRPTAWPGTPTRGAPGLGPRTIALYAIWLARSYLALGEVELGCRVGTRALRYVVAAGSVRTTAELRHLHPVLLRHRDMPVVRRYERLAAIAFRFLPDADRRGGAGGRHASVAV
jgi:transcriptional regulator with XRE-family HTH domain